MITEDEPDGEVISRKYTPISPIFDQGTFDLLVKTYYKNVNPKFPNGGIISQYLDNVKIGESVEIRGPLGRLLYLGDGEFEIIKSFKPLKQLKGVFPRIGMIAMGTGIAPMWQVVNFFLVFLIFLRFYYRLTKIKKKLKSVCYLQTEITYIAIPLLNYLLFRMIYY